MALLYLATFAITVALEAIGSSILDQQDVYRRYKQGALDMAYPELAATRRWIDASPDAKECIPRRWHTDLPWFWFIFGPTFVCPRMQRVGEIFDGGKWICHNPDPPCVVYSFGSNGRTKFESAVSQCAVHVFDPTMDYAPQGNFTFHAIGLGASPGLARIGGKDVQIMTLNGIMRRLGHSRIDIVKIDIDGMEYEVFESPQSSMATLRSTKQLLVEFHWQGADRTAKIFETLHRLGFQAFHHEFNMFYLQQPSAGIEYSFVRKNM